MTTDQTIEIIGAYAVAFGDEHAEELISPDRLGESRFIAALAEAVKSGVPLTPAHAEELFGPPFREEVIEEGLLVLPSDGEPPRRLDGKPLTDDDRALAAGIDPLAEPGAPSKTSSRYDA